MTINVLITGGAGFIASHIPQKYSKRRHDVYVIDDFSTGKRENIHQKYVKEVFETSILNVDNMHQIFKKVEPDIVLHLAAQPSLLESIRRPITDLTSNGVGTAIVAKLCRQYSVSKLVYASTSAVMDKDVQSPTDSIIYEHTPSSPYGISKLMGEIYVRYFMADVRYLKTNATILRLGNVFGPRQVPLGENQLVPRAIRYALGLDDFEVYGDGFQTRDYVYVEDVADAFYKASKSQESGIFYVGSGIERNVWQVLAHIQENFEETIDWQKGKQRDDREKIILDIKPTREVLGWQPKTTLSKGIQKTVKWWKEK
jgi:nucleoside-diphosphate-sugar epimerase